MQLQASLPRHGFVHGRKNDQDSHDEDGAPVGSTGAGGSIGSTESVYSAVRLLEGFLTMPWIATLCTRLFFSLAVTFALHRPHTSHSHRHVIPVQSEIRPANTAFVFASSGSAGTRI